MTISPSPLPLPSPPPPPPLPTTSDAALLRSLLRLSREISLFDPPKSLQKRSFASIARKSHLLSLLFDELLLEPLPDLLPRSAVLCFREILVVFRRFKALLADLAARSRMRLLLQSQSLAIEFHELTVDLSTLLDILPLSDLQVGEDVKDLIDLVRRQCRRSSPAVDPAEDSLRVEVLDLIRDIEREIVPDRCKLEAIFQKLGLDGSKTCRNEIESLEREIGDRVAEKWTSAMISLAGLVRYAKCVLFGASTPRSDSAASLNSPPPEVAADPEIPADFRCPISLDLMRDPVVAASGQTYDREPIERWIQSGHATCPKTGQILSHSNLVPNKALKNLIARWCQEQNIPFDGTAPITFDPAAVGANKAALEAARMTASFLVDKLAASPSTETANRVVHEIRQLAKTGTDVRAFVGEAGAIPIIIPLLCSSNPNLQVNAVTALLNLSILEANKKRIMHADGALDGVIHVLSKGATWRAKENAAAALLSLSAVHSYRRRLGRNSRIIEELVSLIKTGPISTKKDALAAVLSLAADRENIGRLIEGGVIEAAVDAVGTADVAESAVVVLSAMARRGGAAEVGAAEGALSKLVSVLKNGSDSGRENAAAALVLVCRKGGGKAVEDLVAVPGIEWVIWEMIGSGTERGRRKAAALGRLCRRWVAAAAVEEAGRTVSYSAVSHVTVSATTVAQS